METIPKTKDYSPLFATMPTPQLKVWIEVAEWKMHTCHPAARLAVFNGIIAARKELYSR